MERKDEYSSREHRSIAENDIESNNLLSSLWKTIENHMFIPFAEMKDLVKTRERPIFVEGKGIYLKDVKGKEYIDASSGAFCVNIGYGNEKVITAIKRQARKLQYAYYRSGLNEPLIKLSQKLIDIAPKKFNRVRIETTGADAVETAVKIARLYYAEENKNVVISLTGSYHGNTYGTASITGMRYYQEMHERNLSPGTLHIPPPNCYRCPYALEHPKCQILCAHMLENTICEHGKASKVAAFVGEPIMGVGGIITPPDEYWPIIWQICQKYEVLLIMDEIITGLGRTGRLFGYEHWNIEPDMIVLAKGMSSMYQPISAVLLKEQIFEKFWDNILVRHSHTAGGHPIACAAALANIEEIMDNDLIKNAEEKGQYLNERLNEISINSQFVANAGGKGLMQRVEIVKEKKTKSRFSKAIINSISSKCREKGLILRSMGYNSDAMHFTPPLIISEKEIDKVCDIFLEVVTNLKR